MSGRWDMMIWVWIERARDFESNGVVMKGGEYFNNFSENCES